LHPLALRVAFSIACEVQEIQRDAVIGYDAVLFKVLVANQ
jgi:hypothetical protein